MIGGVFAIPPDIPPLTTYTTVLVAEAHEREEIIWTPELGREEAKRAANRYGIDKKAFLETMDCESIHFSDPEIQSGYYRNGVRENSWGYAQFNLPSGLKTAQGDEITKEIAVDPIQALDAAAYNFSIGNETKWTCFND